MKHLVSYLLFVGIPLAGLLGVLRVGQGLVAPVAVHGSYAVQPLAPTNWVCQRYLLSGPDSSIRVTQSGRQLTVALGPKGDITLLGTLSGSEFALEGEILPGSTPRYIACPEGDTVRLTGKVSRESQVKRLEGRLWTLGCDECGTVEFQATRPRRYEGRRRS